ncbi:hypothetical protein LMG23992_04460 [Cupriavidus laharis]|uniref:Bacterial transcriptional activator domain-containing protein n=2 Tax=Cupriavidus laharis TaxID=151654 RepID=A0ABN7ZAW0_9BURK|nr:hypothetical protein LMG23992_04460 [Cupriavidus laharis]
MRGAAPVALPASRRTRALLGYLAVTGVPQSRQALCDLLWNGPDDPRAALRWSLTKLRPVVDAPGQPRLRSDRERVRLDAGEAWLDIARVQTLLAGGVAHATLQALEEAAALLQGEFLSGLDLPGCYRFYHWCTAERERYGGLRGAVLAELVARLQHAPEQALRYARAMVAADPLAEPAHAALVGMLSAAGRYPDAEQHYAHARELLQRELSMPSDGPLDQAIRQARRRQQGRCATPQTGESTAPDTTAMPAPSSPLIGRRREQQILDALVASHSASMLTLLEGEPGIGKTRLLDYLADTARHAGFRVLRGRCYAVEMIRPYGLWSDALRTMAEGWPSASGPEAASGTREQLFSDTAAWLARLAAVQPLAVLLDDLQWMDEGSAALLHYLCRTLPTQAPVIACAAARVAETGDNPWARGLLQSLARDGHLRRLPLRPLDSDEVAALLGPASTLDAAAVARDSGGNPLFVLQLANAAACGQAAGTPTLDELVMQRLDALDHDTRELLRLACALGREVRPRLLADVSGAPLAQVLATLERLERHGLLRPCAEGGMGNDGACYDFSHDVVRQAAYRSMSAPRRRIVHGWIARQLQAQCASDPALHGELAHHAALAGDAALAAKACVDAAEHCLRVCANDEAVSVTERGLGLLDSLPAGQARTHLAVRLLKLRLVAASNRPERRAPALADALRHAVEDADTLGLHEDAAEGLHMLSWLHQQDNDTEGTRLATLAAERMTRKAGAATRCQQLANTARCLLEVESDLPQAQAMLGDAEALAQSLALRVIELAWGQGLLARARGDAAAALDFVSLAVDLARQRQDHWREYECLVWLATIAFERGHNAEVAGHSARIMEAARHMGEADAPFARALGALAGLRQGEASAHAALDKALESLRAIDDKAHLAYALNSAATLLRDNGNSPLIRPLALEALQAARAVRRQTETIIALAHLATVDAANGHAAEAVQWLAELDEAECRHVPGARAAAAARHARAACRAIPTLVPTRSA